MTFRKTRPLFLFYLLVIYVFLQFVSWGYLLFKLNNEIYELKTELISYHAIDAMDVALKHKELQDKLHLRWMMIIGEGSVFLILLVLGALQTRRTFKRESELMNQQKNFLLSVTHELKSPIASIRLQLETLERRELEIVKQKQIVSGAIMDVDRLNGLVENILLAARIENSGFFIHKEQTNLSVFIEDIAKKYTGIGQELKLQLEGNILLAIDRFSFQSIVQNLVENAIKYSSSSTSITLSLVKKEGDIVFSVSDEGMGILLEEREKIFKKFYRIGNEETRQTKGTGLGLYIVKSLVELHGGLITIKSNHPAGSVFEIVFNSTS